jgi:hypothetical protein
VFLRVALVVKLAVVVTLWRAYSVALSCKLVYVTAYVVPRVVLKKGGLGLFRGRSPSISGDSAAPGTEKRQSFAAHGRVTEEKHHHVPLKSRLTVAKALGGGNSAPGSPSAGSHAGTEATAAEEKGLYYCCCGKDEEEDRMAEFKNIFVGGHPLWYFRYGL